ncbi:VENN motif pre-toxin domain-containing protein [Providencia rettgeri]|uniref:VENN motif pre-toxin domain-containing protein n=1 Tax=Providencia TaxID=586 RepID=UPI001B369BA8|nr:MULTISPECIES: VENN motif pre-toxin domain-containing protein [Providencia]MBQ0528513.1 VENN motif pre-toxin domain-containing protein [Providencia rettgeri]WOB87794.1 VENN motif pre-toxin domain-containing protein [Providencia sp. PROV040]
MAQYGTGSDFQKAAQAVTGLLQGLAGDNLAGALANASSPYLATKIKELTKGDDAANAMAHAVLGAVVAELNNQSAVAGGLGAGGGELSAHVIMNTLFPGKEIWELSESEKQQVSALSQLASGLAGGLTTGDVAGAITGSQAAKNAVENNRLSQDERATLNKALDDQEAGKNLKSASLDIIYLIDKDKYTNSLIERNSKGLLNEKEQAVLVEYLNAVGVQLQLRGVSEADAQKQIADILKETSHIGPNLDEQYNQALSQLSTQARQEWQAMIGTDALLAGPGRISQIMRLALISGGSYQTGTGLAQIADGKIAEGSINVGLGGLAVSGGYLGNKVTGKPDVKPDVTPPKGNAISFDANEIRFSQNTVSYNKTELGTGVKYNYDDLVSSMKKDGWKGAPVDVVKMPDGKMTSIDNTRINAARDADIKVEANLRSFDEKLTAAESARFSDPRKGFEPKTWGEAITGRIDKQSGGFSKNNPYGSNEPPRVTGKPKD